MSATDKKKKFGILWLVTVLLFLAAGFTMLKASYTPINADAASGSNIDYSVKADFTLNLDVNGKLADEVSYSDETDSLFKNNNELYLQQRIVMTSVFSTEGTLFNAGDIINYTTEFVSVAASSSGSGAGLTVSKLTFTAKKNTQELKKLPRIKLIYRGTASGESVKEVLIEINITAKFVPGMKQVGGASSTVFVGEQKVLEGTEYVNMPTTNVAEYKKVPIELKNYTTVKIDLGRYIKGRRLYTKDSTDVVTDIVYKNLARPEKNYWMINDTSTMNVDKTSATLLGGDVKVNVSSSLDASGNLYTNLISIDVQITEGIVNRNAKNGGLFWQSQTSEKYPNGITFDLAFKIGTVTGESVSIVIPVQFIPDSLPKIWSNFEGADERGFKSAAPIKTSLNASLSTEEGSGTLGAKTTRVFVSSLCDYPSTYTKSFFDVKGTGDNDNPIKEIDGAATNVVSAVQGKTAENEFYWDITGLKNGTANLVFTVHYGEIDADKGQEKISMNITVTFTVYGDYSINLDTILGTKNREFDWSSSVFSEIRDAGYRMTGANIIKSNSEDKNIYAVASFKNDKLTITPKADCDTGTAYILMTFSSMDGTIIQIKAPLIVDLAGGDFFSGWRPWQMILFWIGVGVAIFLVLILIVWIFIKSIHRRKMDELETTAPTSAYIIKLNSTIAAAQAQQRLATTQAFSNAQTQMLQLGAGPAATAAPNPNILQLNANTATGASSMYSGGAMSMPPMGDFAMPPSPPPTPSEIYIPLSDDELLERIFMEKFEPRGMIRRTFFKSKDLQNRELEKEKERIRDEVRNGRTIEEACKPHRDGDVVTAPKDAPTETVRENPLFTILGFNPDQEIVVLAEDQGKAARIVLDENGFEKIDYNETEEDQKLQSVESVNWRLSEELRLIDERLSKTNSAIEKTDKSIEIANSSLESLLAGIGTLKTEIDDLSFKAATAKGKEKERIAKEIEAKEIQMKADKSAVEQRKAEIESANASIVVLRQIQNKLTDKSESTNSLLSANDNDLKVARKAADLAREREARAKAMFELGQKLEGLNPMLFRVNNLDKAIHELDKNSEMAATEKNSLKTRQQALQSELLATTSSEKISSLSAEINILNKRISELDKSVTSNTKVKADKNIELASVRRKANEFIEKENMSYEDVIAAEDKIIGEIALEELKLKNEGAKNASEELLIACQNRFDDLVDNKDTLLMEAAGAVAARVKETEDSLNSAQQQLDEINEKLENSTDDGEKMDLTLEQMNFAEQVSSLSELLETQKSDGIKANLNCQLKGEKDIESARSELDKAKEEFEEETNRYNETITKINPLDLISSASGLISQDRQKIEASNLKKQLEESKNAMAQAKLQAQMAQVEAEKAILDAQKASDASRAEAEKVAQEAIARAKEAQEIAEKRVADEAEKAKAELEEVKRSAQEEKRTAQEEAEAAKRAAAEATEAAKREAEEETARAKKEAEEAKRLAEEDAQKAKREAEEETQKVKREAEEENQKVKREAEQENQKVKREAEEESQQNAAAFAERNTRINDKVSKRKAEIAALRSELKTIKDDESGTVLHEKFYAIQLGLDEDEKSSSELNDLLVKSMNDASHAAELSRYKQMANVAPKRIAKKVTEHINHVPRRPESGARPAARSAGARPAPGARPTGARPASGARPTGARPAPGARPTGARPAPGARPTGARPAPGTRPTGARPSGAPTRPAPKR